MKKGVVLSLCVVFLMLLYVIYRWYKEQKEFFDVYPSIEERVIMVYNDVLERSPTAKELITNTRDIKDNKLTWDGLRQQLIDQDEYVMNIKLQSNVLTPELKKMIADSRIIAELSNLYLYVINTQIPSKFILPTRDIYIALNYNPFALVALLQDEKFPNFRQDLMLIEGLDKNKTLDLFTKTFDQVALIQKASEMSKSPNAKNIISLLQSQSASPQGATDNTLSIDEQQKIRGMLATYSEMVSKIRSIEEKDTDMSAQIEDILNRADGSVQTIGMKHDDDMVLRPEFSWSVPQRHPPVCTVPGQPPIIQPLLNDSKLMLGTPLCEAEQTQVGSIMPMFEYKEMPTPSSSSTPESNVTLPS